MNRNRNLPSFLIEQVDNNKFRVRGKNCNSLLGPTRTQRQQGVQQQQSSLAGTQLGVLAACWVDSDAATPVYRSQRGFASTAITRNGAGDYTLTTTDAMSLTIDLLITCGLQAGTIGLMGVDVPTANTIRTKTASATVVPAITAADLDYWLKVENFGPA